MHSYDIFWHAQERDTVRLEEGSNQLSSGNIINLDNLGGIPNSHRLNGNDRLPGAVLLARERLLERLRSVSLSRNRLVLSMQFINLVSPSDIWAVSGLTIPSYMPN